MREQSEPASDGQEGITIAFIWALTLQLPLRLRIGKNILGMQAFFGLLFVVFYGGLFASPPVLCWAAIYFSSIVLHRIATLRRRFRGDEPHSYYNGYPLIGKILGRRFEEAPVKAVLEPLLAGLIGILCAPFGQPSVMFFWGGAVCMVVSTIWTELKHCKRKDDLRDAIIEGELMRPSYRKRRW